MLLGKKIGMTQVYDDQGRATTVTVILAGPCTVMQVKTPDRDGYWAVQVGFDDRKRKGAKKPQLVQARALKIEPKRFVKEIRLDAAPEVEAGAELGADVFKDVGFVDVSGVTKGKGFQGVMKRHGFHGHPGSHGSSKDHRAPGSIGQSSDPSRVFKGTRMPGHMGNAACTVCNLRIVKVDPERNLLTVEGAVPGAKGGYLVVRVSRKVKAGSEA